MGQAKQRGTHEQRVAQAMRRNTKSNILGFIANVFTFGLIKR